MELVTFVQRHLSRGRSRPHPALRPEPRPETEPLEPLEVVDGPPVAPPHQDWPVPVVRERDGKAYAGWHRG